MNPAPDIKRIRHELKRRQLSVATVERLSPAMLRIILQGAELEGFTSLGFDDHVKLIFPAIADPNTPGDPTAPDGAAGAAVMRDFTPRYFSAEARQLWIDFFLHEAGPAAAWAAQVAPGQSLMVGGPKGSAIIAPAAIDMHLFVGDETALPAIGRRLEELPSSAQALAVVETADGLPCYPLATRGTIKTVWVARAARTQTSAAANTLIAALRGLEIPQQRCFAWAALESHAARAIRRYLVDERHWDPHWIKAAGYWQRDAASVHEVIRDEE